MSSFPILLASKLLGVVQRFVRADEVEPWRCARRRPRPSVRGDGRRGARRRGAASPALRRRETRGGDVALRVEVGKQYSLTVKSRQASRRDSRLSSFCRPHLLRGDGHDFGAMWAGDRAARAVAKRGFSGEQRGVIEDRWPWRASELAGNTEMTRRKKIGALYLPPPSSNDG